MPWTEGNIFATVLYLYKFKSAHIVRVYVYVYMYVYIHIYLFKFIDYITITKLYVLVDTPSNMMNT